MRSLALLHFIVNAILLWLAYYWLGIGESRTSTLLWSAFIALLAVCLACSAYGAVFAYFRTDAYFQTGQRRRTRTAWSTALRHLLPLLLATAAVAIVYVLLAYIPKPATPIASYLTMTFRKPVSPASILRIFNAVLWVVDWIVLPVLVLPMLSAIAAQGWRGLSAFGSRTRQWLYWIEAPVLLLCAVWIPWKILQWVPQMSSFRMEMVSF